MSKFIASASLTLLLYAPITHAAYVTGNGNVITLSGTVNEAAVAKLKLLVGPNTTTIRIASPGGDSDAMLELAELVVKRGWTVAVTGICAASCASTVFIAGRRRLIEPDSIVMFQRTSIADIEIYDAVNDRIPTEWKDEAKRRAVREVELLTARRVGLHVAHDFLWSTKPICIGLVAGLGGQVQQRFISRYSAWVPDKKYMQENNLHFSGFWPQSQPEVEKHLAKWAGPNARLVRFGNTDHVPDERPAGNLKFGICQRNAN